MFVCFFFFLFKDYFIRAAERFLRVNNNYSFKVNLLDPVSIKGRLENNFDIICVPLRNKSKKNFRPPKIDIAWQKKDFVFEQVIDSILGKCI